MSDALAGLYGASERIVVDELPFVLQGAQTEHFRWIDRDFGLLLPVLAPPLLQTVHSLAEPAMLYRYLRSVVSQPPRGLIMQALYNSIDEELQQYLLFVSGLEKRVRAREDAVTLSDCVALLQQPVLALRLLFAILEQSQKLVGGQILSLLHRHTRHGSQFVEEFCARLLAKTQVPFNDFLAAWVGSGTLKDPYSEFFVQISDPASRWAGRFALVDELVPTTMAAGEAKRAFDIGTALYFLRSLCMDDDFVIAHASQAAPAAPAALISQTFVSVIEHVNRQLADKFELKVHLKALKDYMLLNKGDFVETLLREGGPVLSQPAESLVRHQLTTALETAIYTSNAQFDPPQVLTQLDARVLGIGELGWQVFAIDYQVPDPLDVIVGDAGMQRYRQVFNFLWRLHYAAYALSTVWRSGVTAQRSGFGAAVREQQVEEEWQAAIDGWTVMSHFVNELQLYIYTEVIEGAWKTLMDKLARLATLDEIIAAHGAYLASIRTGVMLGGGEVLGELQVLLDSVLDLCNATASLHTYIVHRQVARQLDAVTAAAARVASVQADFVTRVDALLGQLDEDTQSFSTRLNFNNYYQA